MRTHRLLIVLALVVASCKTAKLVETWEPKDHVGPPYTRVMIVGLGQNPHARSQYENDFADKLAGYGVLPLASINVVPELEQIDHETVQSWLKEYSLDGVIVTRVSITKPPRRYAPPHTSLSGWYGAWADESQAVVPKEDFYLGVDLFDARTEQILYSAVVKTKIKDDRTEPIHAVIDRVAADMVDRGYFSGG